MDQKTQLMRLLLVIIVIAGVGYFASQTLKRNEGTNPVPEQKNEATDPSSSINQIQAEEPPKRDEGREPQSVSAVKLFFIALNDNGVSGKKIGCNDSLIPVETQIEPTTAPLNEAFRKMFSLKDPAEIPSGLYNALSQSNLLFQNAIVENSTALVQLTGTVKTSSACDDARFMEQLRATAEQFSEVQKADIYINGVFLEDLFQQNGEWG